MNASWCRYQQIRHAAGEWYGTIFFLVMFHIVAGVSMTAMFLARG